MTKEEIKLRIDELDSERTSLNYKINSLYNEIKTLQNQLDYINSMEIAPKILDPLIGKLIIINNDSSEQNFSVIKLDHWEIDESIPSGVNLFYTKMYYKRYNAFGSFSQKYFEDMPKYFISVELLDIIEPFEGSDIQKKYPSIN